MLGAKGSGLSLEIFLAVSTSTVLTVTHFLGHGI